MYFWILAVYVIVEFSFLISGIPEELRQSICISYEKQRYDEMYDEILKMRDRVLAKNETDPCVLNMKYITGIKNITVNTFDVQIEVITGDFGDNNGYELIVDEKVTIHIPAIIKCVYKFKHAIDRIRYKRPDVVYYMVMHGIVGNFDFENVFMADRISKQNLSVFILEESADIVDLLRSYKHNVREFKSLIKTWFQRKQDKPNKLKDFCGSLTSYGKPIESTIIKPKKSTLGIATVSSLEKPKESSSAEWKVISGRVEIGPKILRVSNDTEIELVGIIVCKVSIRHNEETTAENEYFTMSKYGKKDEDKMFVGIYGPIKEGNKQIFVLESGLLENDKN